MFRQGRHTNVLPFVFEKVMTGIANACREVTSDE